MFDRHTSGILLPIIIQIPFVENKIFSDAHHLNGAGAEKFTAILCKTIQRRAAGESVGDLFYQTVEEKLTLTPDDSVLMAYYAKLQDE